MSWNEDFIIHILPQFLEKNRERYDDIVEANSTSIEPVSVKGKLDFGGESKGGILSKIKSLATGGKDGPSVNVTAKVTNFIAGEQAKAVDVIGRITKMTDNGSTGTVDAIARVTSVIKAPVVAGEPVLIQAKATVNTVVDKGEQGRVASQISGLEKNASSTQTMKVKADTKSAEQKINRLIDKCRQKYIYFIYK